MNAILICACAFAVVFNVRDFGAKGDGVAKDTTAIQAAIDKANAAGGGPIEPGLMRTARMRNIHFTGFSGRASAQVGDWRSSIAGCSEDCPIEDVKFRDIDVDTVLTVEHAKDVSVADSKLRLMKKSLMRSNDDIKRPGASVGKE